MLESLLGVKLERPRGQCLNLGHQLMRPILSRLLCICCLDQVHLERLIQYHHYVLDLRIHFDHDVHQILRVFLVLLALIQPVNIYLVSLQTQHLYYTVFSLCLYGP